MVRYWLVIFFATLSFLWSDAGRATPLSFASSLQKDASISNSDRTTIDALTWKGASSADTLSAYRTYLEEFPDGLFAELAKDRISKLTPATSASTPASDPASLDDNGDRQAIVRGDPVLPPPPVSEADRAYVPPKAAEPPLPQLPPTPVLFQSDYPDCRENHHSIAEPFDKAEDINRCTVALDRYYTDVLNAFRKRMNEHQNEISDIYTQKVAGNRAYSAASRQKFYQEMRKEHADSNPDGVNLATHRAAVELYNLDRNYLRDRFCFNTGCGGYPVPMSLAEQKKADKKANRKSAGKKCKKSRGRGRLLGGIFGGIAGKAAGLSDVGVLIASAAGAVLVGELACQLDEKEQEKAAEATVQVTRMEQVGATASWKSPTRAGVSGTSTVTALNTQPDGRRCLSITDVAIIDGEETRISKQMCRGAGENRYVIMA